MTNTPSAPLSLNVNARLSGMMFLQYGIWGAWLPILFPFMGYRGFSANESFMIFAAGAAGAIIGPFIAGQVADRYFSTERFLGISHLLGAVLVWFLSEVKDANTFLVLSLLYGLIYAPTLALTNSLSFHHVPDRDRDFGRVRVWGTIGWIAAGIAVGQWLGHVHSPPEAERKTKAAPIVAQLESGEDAKITAGLDAIRFAVKEKETPAARLERFKKEALKPGDTVEKHVMGVLLEQAQNAGRSDAFRLSAFLGVLMGIYCFTLPHTPPAKEARQSSAILEALGEVKFQPLLTLFLLAVPVSMIHQFYFVHTSGFLTALQNREADAKSMASTINNLLGVGGGGLMTIGQMTEIFVLTGIPLIAKRVSRRELLAAGLLAYGARMALFAYTTNMYTILLGVALHGFCFGCFIFVAFMVVDENTTGDVRASAQNLFNLVIVGIGIIVGSWFAIYVVDAKWAKEGPAAEYYTRLFSVPMWMSAACVVLLFLFYPGGRKPAAPQAS